MDTQKTTLAAWKMAVKKWNFIKGLIFYSDRGEYASEKITNYLDSYKLITLGTSRKGNS